MSSNGKKNIFILFLSIFIIFIYFYYFYLFLFLLFFIYDLFIYFLFFSYFFLFYVNFKTKISRRFIQFCRRRQLIKNPTADTSMKLLMSAEPRDLTTHPSDPVELRRLNYQTPAMMSHPPIPVTELANHIERLKANDNMKFSQEYESIEPGQQFTWENSNLEVNKPKNRYANVIAYDHSRVVLQPLDGIPGSDYVNANYCDGYRKQNAYIATQGPLPETFGKN